MSREIKFRVWTTSGLDSGYMYNFDMSSDGYPRFQWDRVALEQYTGLKDKNGKEIYEGDIVGIYQEYSDKEGSKTWEELEPWGQVTYEDSRARFGIWGDSPYEGEDRHFFDLVEGLEVIGNIHENGDLLK